MGWGCVQAATMRCEWIRMFVHKRGMRVIADVARCVHAKERCMAGVACVQQSAGDDVHTHLALVCLLECRSLIVVHHCEYTSHALAHAMAVVGQG